MNRQHLGFALLLGGIALAYLLSTVLGVLCVLAGIFFLATS